MKNKKVVLRYIVVIMIIGLLGGCENPKNNNTQTKEENIEEDNDNIPSEDSVDTKESTEQENIVLPSTFSFADLSNLEFWFGSGVGGWCTTLSVNADGTFEGQYHDFDLGDIGEGYSEGICHLCNFVGKFTEPAKVNEYTYSVTIDKLEIANKVDSEEIIDNVKYIYSHPYGVYDATQIYFYLKGAPVKDLPQEYKDWVSGSGISNDGDAKLPYYGLYNVNAGDGFSSALYEEYTMDDELKSIEQTAKEYTYKLEHEDLTQLELNTISGQLYRLWDNELNWIWIRLKVKLDSDSMSTLTKKEREWIKTKESEVKKAGAEYEGGSMQPMVENMKAAELTKDRVYELAEYLR